MGGRTCFTREILPLIAMVTAQCLGVGLSTIFKAASSKGLDYHVYMFYSYAIAALVSTPLAFFSHRNTELPPFKLSFLLQMFAVGMIAFTAQLLGYRGIELGSPTLASAMSNLTPAATFILAILFRMEKLKIKTLSSQAKIIGTILTISGALVVVLYKGPSIITSLTPSTSNSSLYDPSTSNSSLYDPSTSQQYQWMIGGVLLAVSYIIFSMWYIIMAKVVKDYPELIVVSLFYISCTIVSGPVCFIAQPNLSAWKIQPDITLAAILYSGIVGEVSVSLLLAWALHVKGPVYVALFNPISIVIAAFMSFIFLGDSLYLGSIIGGIIISGGFYIVMWAKAQDVCQTFQEGNQISSTSAESNPLLQA